MKNKSLTLIKLLGIIVILVTISLIIIKCINSKQLLPIMAPKDKYTTTNNIVDNNGHDTELDNFSNKTESDKIINNDQDNQIVDFPETSKGNNTLSSNDIITDEFISDSENIFSKQIGVKNGVLYNNNSNTFFQILGINFDNNTWNPSITAINTGHDETSYAELVAMGFNTIRFGLSYNMTLQDNFFEWLDTNVKQAESVGLKIILDMHTSQDGIQIRDKDATYRFWQSEELQQGFIDTWVRIAKHYSQNNTVIMYDLLNEPLVIIDQDQNADDIYYNFISKLVESIRKVDKQTVICIEGYSSSILKYNEHIDETNYVANTTNSSNIIQKINDDNIVFDVHNYSPTEYTFQTEKLPVAYSDLYTVKDKKSWLENSDYYIIQTSTTDEWFLYESELYKLTDSDSNYGNIRYIYDKEPIGSSILIDNIVVEEYDKDMKFIQNVYEFSFDKSDYEWNTYGTQSYEIDSQGYDNIGGSLKLTSIGESGILTLRIDNTGFNTTVGNYYKIKAYIKSTSILDKRNARMSLIFANVGFAGGLKELSDYNFSKYQTYSNETKIPMICNEFGTNYNSIKNSDGAKYLYEVFTAIYKYKINISLFSYSGFDFGLMYDNTRNFGTEKSKIRQDSYDALYKAIHQDNTYTHIFKNVKVMQDYANLRTGDKILVLGETLAGVGSKLEYVIIDYPTSNSKQLSNGLYALPQ